MPGVRLLQYDYEIERGPLFRWPKGEVRVLGELVWPASAGVGDTVAAKIGAEGEALNIVGLTLQRTGGTGFGDLQGLERWEIGLRAKADSESQVPSLDEPLTLIIGDAEGSAGAAVGCLNSSSRMGALFEVEGDFDWCGEIPPGARVQIVLPAHRAPIPFSFTFDVESLPPDASSSLP